MKGKEYVQFAVIFRLKRSKVEMGMKSGKVITHIQWSGHIFCYNCVKKLYLDTMQSVYEIHGN